MSLCIFDSGASTEEIERGIAAANAVFEKNGVTAEDADAAQTKIDNGEIVTSQETMRAVVWGEADAAAVVECCKGWLKIPESAHLEFRSDK